MKLKIFFFFVTLVLLALPLIYKLPIPADTIPGLYYPQKDLPFKYPNGVPVENPLITDPVRQQFAWKFLAINQLKSGSAPLWNPYNLTGTPLLANFQTGAFYPINIVFLIPNWLGSNDIQHFATLWSYYIYLQIPLSIAFMYLYLRKIGLAETASLYGGGIWAFSGFTAAWWEWGNIVHTLLYFPLILYAIENIIERDPVEVIGQTAVRKSLLHPLFSTNKYKLILLFSLCASFFAGHLQTFLLVAVNTGFYILYKIPLVSFKQGKILFESTQRRLYYWMQLLQILLLFSLIVAAQALPTFDLLTNSARNIDTHAWQRKDWFFPTEHLITLVAPDFFGNPATYNYWGIWNYGEFAAYIGIFPLIFALAIIIQFFYDQIKKIVPSLSFKLSHKEVSSETLDIIQENAGVGFFLIALFINMVLITRNPITETIYAWNIPFLTSTQPSRGIAIVDFALVVLSAVGFHKTIRVLRTKTSLTSFLSIKTNINFAYIALFISIVALWYGVIMKQSWFLGVLDKAPDFDVFKVARSNLILPTFFCMIAFFCLRYYYKSLEKEYAGNSESISGRVSYLVIGIIVTISILDIGRFFLKFESFSNREFLYPSVNILRTLQQSQSRYMTEDSRIMAPNMNIPYALATVEGYDPLYLNDYGKLIGLWQRNQADLSPFNANRILTPHTPKSIVADIAAASHLISFGDYTAYTKLGESGITKLYERTTALPRFSIIPAMRGFKTEQDLANYMFSSSFDPYSEALFILKGIQKFEVPKNGFYTSLGSRNNSIKLKSESATEINLVTSLDDSPGLLYIADAFDKGWIAFVDGKQTSIIKTNIAFRGIQLAPGNHEVMLRYQPQSFITGVETSLIGVVVVFLLAITSKRTKKSQYNT